MYRSLLFAAFIGCCLVGTTHQATTKPVVAKPGGADRRASHLALFHSEDTTSGTGDRDQDEDQAPVLKRKCPFKFFACHNGECISPEWRCDGHYDCDDLTDELNCTIIDGKLTAPIQLHTLATTTTTTTTPSPALLAHHSDRLLEHEHESAQYHKLHQQLQQQLGRELSETGELSEGDDAGEDANDIQFVASSEPLMLFSTGSSVRGFWMRSKIYFDIVANHQRPAKTPSVTGAWSVFFDLLNLERAPAPAPADSSTAKPSAAAATANGGSANDDEHAAGSARSKATIVGVDMDPEFKQVYWVELGKESGVYSIAIDDEQFEARQRRRLVPVPRRVAMVESVLLSPEDISLDLVGRNMYITDAGIPAIVACSMQRAHTCKVLADSNLHKPRAIIADSSTGWLTYTDWGDNPGIYLMSMDGARRETLIDSDVVWPNGLAADYQNNQLYWADAGLMKIEVVDLRSRKRSVIVKERAGNPFSLSVFESHLYWSDWAGSDIKMCHKLSGNNTRSMLRAESIYGIHIYHPNIYPHQHADPCWHRHCSHMCLLKPTTSTYADRRTVDGTCACPNSMQLVVSKDADGAITYTCKGAHEDETTKTPLADVAASAAASLSSSPSAASNNSDTIAATTNDSSVLWLIVLLLLLSFAGLAALVSLLVLYRQGRLPRQVSDFSVSFISTKQDKDGAMLLMDNDT